MTDDVFINKAAIIDRCLKRIVEEYQNDPTRLENFTIQDSVVLNLQRCCEAVIDLAMHIVARENLGVPQSSRDAFTLLANSKRIPLKTASSMQAMVGFRNIAVHSYQELQFPILQAILEHHLNDFSGFLVACKKS